MFHKILHPERAHRAKRVDRSTVIIAAALMPRYAGHTYFQHRACVVESPATRVPPMTSTTPRPHVRQLERHGIARPESRALRHVIGRRPRAPGTTSASLGRRPARATVVGAAVPRPAARVGRARPDRGRLPGPYSSARVLPRRSDERATGGGGGAGSSRGRNRRSCSGLETPTCTAVAGRATPRDARSALMSQRGGWRSRGHPVRQRHAGSRSRTPPAREA